MKDSKAVKLIALAHDQGYVKGYEEGRREYAKDLAEAGERASAVETEAFDRGYAHARSEARDANNPEALAQAKSQAYDRGYKQGLEDQGKKTLELMAEARASERQKIEAAEPKLSVWFKSCGPSPKPPEAYPPGLDKIDAIQAIREAYGSDEGYGLKDVQDMVEAVSFGARVVCGQTLPQSKAVTLYLQLQAVGFDPELKS